MALDVSGLTILVARGERARCEWVIGWLARVGAECTSGLGVVFALNVRAVPRVSLVVPI